MNNLTAQQTTQILSLRKEGYSIRDIAAELDIKKFYIEQLLNQHRAATLPPISTPATSLRTAPTSIPVSAPSAELVEKERQLKVMQTQLEADRVALTARARTLTAQEKQLANQSSMVAVTAQEHRKKQQELQLLEEQLIKDKREWESRSGQLGQVLREMPDEDALYQAFRKLARGEKLIDRHNLLVQELLDNCDDCTWSGQEVDEYLEKAESIKDKVVSFCDENGIDPFGLLIYQALVFLVKDVEQELEEQTSGFFSGSSVRFDYGPIHQSKLTSLLVESFNDPAPEGLNQPDETEDDESE